MAKKKDILDNEQMLNEFFTDKALLGIVCPMPAYKFCWLVNQYMDIQFAFSQPIEFEKRKKKYSFSLFSYTLPDNDGSYYIYKLKSYSQSLLPELKQMDFLWMIENEYAEEQADTISTRLRSIPNIQLVQPFVPEQLKSRNFLVL
jgi:hypothetical protein